MPPQSSPKDSSSNPSPATTPSGMVSTSSAEQTMDSQQIVIQQQTITPTGQQQVHLVPSQVLNAPPTNATLTSQQSSSLSQQQIIEVPGNSTNVIDHGNSSRDISTNNNNTTISSSTSNNKNITNLNASSSSSSQSQTPTNSNENSTPPSPLPQHLTSIDSQNSNNNASQLEKNSCSSTSDTNNALKSSVTGSTDSSDSVTKGPNITVAANIANTFINISSNQRSIQSSPTQNVNVISVSQPLTQHFMKTLTIGTSRGNIFVPNVIATNLTPQFTVHHHQYGLHPNSAGPAPNVTVNPNGDFATNSNAVIRPHTFQTTQFKPFISNQPASNSSQNVMQSPILAASLQTINKLATNQVINQPIGKVAIISQQSNRDTKSPLKQDENDRRTPTRSQTPSNSAVDQQIRVLTPSEIMSTLPSLSNQDAQIIPTNSQNNSNHNNNENNDSQTTASTNNNNNNNSTVSTTTNNVASTVTTTSVTTQNAQNEQTLTVRIDTKRKKISRDFFHNFTKFFVFELNFSFITLYIT